MRWTQAVAKGLTQTVSVPTTHAAAFVPSGNAPAAARTGRDLLCRRKAPPLGDGPLDRPPALYAHTFQRLALEGSG